MWNLLGKEPFDYLEKCAQDAITPCSLALMRRRKGEEKYAASSGGRTQAGARAAVINRTTLGQEERTHVARVRTKTKNCHVLVIVIPDSGPTCPKSGQPEPREQGANRSRSGRDRNEQPKRQGQPSGWIGNDGRRPNRRTERPERLDWWRRRETVVRRSLTTPERSD
ncbi:hypothetical protein GCM10027569_11890 [Flindersiella endophytica]